jgi:Zn-dependent protease
MIRFHIFGIPVTVQPFFWITMALIGGFTVDSKEGMIRLLFFVTAGFISILVHELGHALTAMKFGARVEIVLEAFGGYASYVGARISRLQGAMITAAGPGLQMVLGGLGIALLRAVPAMPDNARMFVELLVLISFFWAILNLLPVLPMDGGRLLEAALGPKRMRATLTISLVAAVVVAVLGLLYTRSLLLPVMMGYFGWLSLQELRRSRW